jgi:hypothetical protein
MTMVADFLYVVDYGNSAIRKIDRQSGTTSTLVKDAAFVLGGIATDGSQLFSSTYSSILAVSLADGTNTRIAGGGGPGSADGPVGVAKFWEPQGMVYLDGNLYIADSQNHTIRKVVVATGETTTLVGEASRQGAVDGAATLASFRKPMDITTDGQDLHVTDHDNCLIRKIDLAELTVSTVAGREEDIGDDDGDGGDASFSFPLSIAYFDGVLYVGEAGSRLVRRVVIDSGRVTTIAGDPDMQMTDAARDGTGAAARFARPGGIVAVDGTLYVSDYFAIRTIK